MSSLLTATFSLPILQIPELGERDSRKNLPWPPRSRATRIEWIDRRGRALHASPYGTQSEVLGLNLARGCGHRCGFCSARAYASHPGDAVLQVYSHTPQQVEDELAARYVPPRAVLLCPSTDPFPPSSEVQAETVRVVHVLAQRGVEAWLMTRGYIRPFALNALTTRAKSVKVLVALTTMDRNLQRRLEPGTASPRLRIKQIGQLRRAGVRVQVALDPLLPNLTDTRANLAPVLNELSAAGIKQISIGYAFLRSGITEDLQSVLRPESWDELVLDAYKDGITLASEGVAPARYLSKARRQRGYAAVIALASRHGIAVNVSPLSNPDFMPPRWPTRTQPTPNLFSIKSTEAKSLFTQ